MKLMKAGLLYGALCTILLKDVLKDTEKHCGTEALTKQAVNSFQTFKIP